MWGPDRKDCIWAADGIIVDQNRAACLPDSHVRPDPDAADRDRLGAAGPQRVDHKLQIPVEDDLPVAR
jgi:hypothetical protein